MAIGDFFDKTARFLSLPYNIARQQGLPPYIGATSNLLQELTKPRFPSGTSSGSARKKTVQAGARPKSSIRSARQPGQQDPLAALFAELIEGLRSPVGVDESGIRGQLDPIFDARRGIIENQMSRAEERIGRGRDDVENMYEQLAQDYEQKAPEARAQAEAAQAEVEELYGQLRNNIEGNFTRISDEQADLFKKLGIEDAAPGIMDSQGEMAASGMSRADELGTINEQRYMDMGNIDESYYKQGAPLSRLAGSNISSDLLMQLEDFLSERSGELSMVEAERTSGLQQALQQAKNQASSQEQQNTQMLWQIMQQQMQGREPAELTPESFLGSLPAPVQQEVGQAFRRLERSPEAIFGRVQDPRHPVPGTFVNLTDEWWLDSADQMLQRGELSQTAHQALVQFLRLRHG